VSYSTPVFNLVAQIWRPENATTDPPANPPDVVTMAQLRVTPRSIQGMMDWEANPVPEPYSGMQVFSVFICVPKETDIRGPTGSLLFPTIGDKVQIGSTGWYYWVLQVEDVAKGFTNEYRIAALAPAFRTWPKD